MLAPDARVLLRDQLRPPAGFELDRAVATTFTLDLTAALVAPMAFAAFALDGAEQNPIAVMEAVRRSAARIDIFCQAGMMTVPKQGSTLVAFLEPMVHEVRRPKPGALFHPKIWVLRYVQPDTGEFAFRLVCSSRNLTFDRCWDALVVLDGTQGTRPLATNKPLFDLVRALPDLAREPLASERRKAIDDLAEGLRRVDWEAPEDVNEVTFHALGIKGQPKPDFSGYRHLVVSPFVNDDGLEAICAGSERIDLVSRPEHLDRLSAAWLQRCDVHELHPLAVLEMREAAETSGDHVALVGLHAKVVVAERARLAHLFIGSMNATKEGVKDNVEFLVELTGGWSKLGVERFVGADSGFRSLLSPYDTAGGEDAGAEETERWKLESYLVAIAERPFVAIVVQDGDAVREEIRVPSIGAREGVAVRVGLLTRPANVSDIGSEGGLVVVPLVDLTEVSPFVVVTATSGDLTCSTVVKARLEGDPPDRLDAVLASQVDTPEKLLRFIMLVLGMAEPAQAVMNGTTASSAGAAAWGGSAGLFESLVRALGQKPAVILEVDRLVCRLESSAPGRSLLPPGFLDVWAAFREAANELCGADE